MFTFLVFAVFCFTVESAFYVSKDGTGDSCLPQSRCSLDTALGKCVGTTNHCDISFQSGNYDFADHSYSLESNQLYLFGESSSVDIKSSASPNWIIDITGISKVLIERINFKGIQRPLIKCSDLDILTVNETHFSGIVLHRTTPLFDFNIQQASTLLNSFLKSSFSDFTSTALKNETPVVFSFNSAETVNFDILETSFDTIDAQFMNFISTSTIYLRIEKSQVTNNKQRVFYFESGDPITFEMKETQIKGNGNSVIYLSTDNNSRLKSTITDCRIEDNILWESSTISYYATDTSNLVILHENNNYTNNECTYLSSGAAVFVDSDSQNNPHDHSITFKNERFVGNSIYGNYGGALVINVSGKGQVIFEDCVFEKNSISGIGSGGAISFENFNDLTVSVSHCTFNENTADEGNAGAIYVHWSLPSKSASFQMSFSHTNFYGNKALSSDDSSIGGAIHVESIRMGNTLLIEFEHCKFTSQNAGYGGVIGYISKEKYKEFPVDVTYDFTNCTFEDNIVDFKGGVVYVDGLNSLNFKDCHFLGNKAVKDPKKTYIQPLIDSCGGAVYITSGKMEIGVNCVMNEGVLFEKNEAGDFGGALYSDNVGVLGITGSSFISNIAGNGGGNIYIKMDKQLILSTVKMTNNVQITEGEASLGGGMVMDVDYTYPSSIWSQFDCSVTKNDAKNGGGGIFFQRKFFTNLNLYPSLHVKENTIGHKVDPKNIHDQLMTSPNEIIWGEDMTGKCRQEKHDNDTYSCIAESVSYKDGFNMTLVSDQEIMYPIDLIIQIYNYSDGLHTWPIKRYEYGETSTSSISFDLNFPNPEQNDTTENITLIFSQVPHQYSQKNITLFFYNRNYPNGNNGSSFPMYWWAIIIGVSLIVALFVIGIVVIILVNEYIREYSSSAKKRRRKKKQNKKNDNLKRTGSVNARYTSNLTKDDMERIPLRKDFPEDDDDDDEEEEEEDEGEEEEEIEHEIIVDHEKEDDIDHEDDEEEDDDEDGILQQLPPIEEGEGDIGIEDLKVEEDEYDDEEKKGEDE